MMDKTAENRPGHLVIAPELGTAIRMLQRNGPVHTPRGKSPVQPFGEGSGKTVYTSHGRHDENMVADPGRAAATAESRKCDTFR